MTPFILKILLAAHITGGVIALLCAGGALVAKKGRPGHRFFGKGYVAGMTAVFLSALPLAAFQTNLFLLLIAFFSFYLVFSGFRFARNQTGAPEGQDWIAVGVAVLSGVGMWGLGFFFFMAGNDQWVTLIVFGTLGTLLGVSDGAAWIKGTLTGRKRIARHLTNMLAGTISTVTAVLVVNVATNPPWIAWIAPTIVITPLIIYWNRRTLSAGYS